MSQRPGSFVNAAGIFGSDKPAEVVRKLDAAWEADMVESTARRMFEQQADKLAAPWERQWEPTKAHWRTRAIEASTSAAREAVTLAVWFGSMPESNGMSNWSAILHRKGESLLRGPNICIERSEYPDRVRYEADRLRYIIGEIEVEPDITAYDTEAHSGYIAPVAAAPVDAEVRRLIDAASHYAQPMPGEPQCLVISMATVAAVILEAVEAGTRIDAGPKGGSAFRGIEGWSIAKNADGTVGVVCTDVDGPGGDIAIKNAGRFEQRLLYALAVAIADSPKAHTDA